ncbi:hypothetical protein [Sporolactobacillus terrae]|uniref:hypothetical protein n=1 Tax=Sporolactobacillus terrae TaxID=269673 RepID=UPI00048F8255|nr:hypothetical protein [Sporolactobacillus terrae]
MQKIDEALIDALAEGGSLNDDLLGNAAWSGKNKKTFLAFMDVVLQYQRKMTTLTSKHVDTLKSLQKHSSTFSQTDEVSKIKGL